MQRLIRSIAIGGTWDWSRAEEAGVSDNPSFKYHQLRIAKVFSFRSGVIFFVFSVKMASFSFPRLFALVLLVLVASSLGAKPLGREVCPASCYYALLNAKFAAADEKSQAACTNPLRVKSTFYCIALHCNGEDVGPGINWWATTCKSKKTVNLDAYNTAVSKVNDSYLDGLPTVDYKSKKGKVVNGTVLPSDANWLIVHRSVKTYSDMREYADKIRCIIHFRCLPFKR